MSTKSQVTSSFTRLYRAVLIVGTLTCVIHLLACRPPIRSNRPRAECCTLCSSMRNVYTNGLIVPYLTTYRGSTCSHEWVDGSSVTYPDAVSNNIVVLLRSARGAGAIIIRGKEPHSNDIAYEWWYRKDGKGVLDGSDGDILQGAGRTRVVNGHTELTAGEFHLRWFDAWAYGQLEPTYLPGPRRVREAIGVCVTTNRNVIGLDAMASNWVYETLCGTKIGAGNL